MNWQPIETAPKDGTFVLLTDGVRAPLVGKWYPAKWHTDKGFWEDDIALDGWNHPGVFTHWMPLPEPPK